MCSILYKHFSTYLICVTSMSMQNQIFPIFGFLPFSTWESLLEDQSHVLCYISAFEFIWKSGLQNLAIFPSSVLNHEFGFEITWKANAKELMKNLMPSTSTLICCLQPDHSHCRPTPLFRAALYTLHYSIFSHFPPQHSRLSSFWQLQAVLWDPSC